MNNKLPQKIIPAKNKIDVGINIANDYWYDWIDEVPLEKEIKSIIKHYELVSSKYSLEEHIAFTIRKMLKGENIK